MGDYVSALSTAESAYEIPGIKEKSVLLKRAGADRSGGLLAFSDKDRCGIFLLLAKSYAANKKGDYFKINLFMFFNNTITLYSQRGKIYHGTRNQRVHRHFRRS
jgi:hypothetical protein